MVTGTARSLFEECLKYNLVMSLELFYFDIPGKGEPIRLACAYVGIPLVDTRIDRDTLVAMKESGELKYGQVPALRVDGKDVINQSNAIMRYIGRKAPGDALYPADLVHASLIDSILDAEGDLFAGLTCSKYKARYGYYILEDRPDSEELLANVRKSLNDEVIPRHLGNLEKIMGNSTTGWIGNTEGPSIADFVLVPRLEWLANFGDGEGISADILKPFPKLCGLMERLMQLPEIKAYYAAKK
jgi:prostaglandin-H2 D-isomerase / glutathione transferase